MDAPLRILLLEDDRDDALLLERALHAGGVQAETRRVETRADFEQALRDFAPAVILADYKLPAFDGRAAIRLARQQCPGTPVIIVTGAMSDEDAVTLLREGAADYILKDRLSRLGPAVRRALEEAREQAALRAAEEARRAAEAALERRVAERTAELRRAQAEIESYYQAAPIGLCVFDTGMRYLHINKRLAEINGAPAEAHLGRHVREMVPGVAERCIDALQQVIDSGKPVLGMEIHGTTPAHPEDRHDYMAHWFPLLGDEGRLLGVSVAVDDVTDQKRAQAQIEALNRDLQERTAQIEAANKDLEGFSYSVSHDLRAPLRAIDSFSKLALEEYGRSLDAEGQRLLNVIRRNAQTMGRLIDDILAFSRASRRTLERGDVNVTALAREVLAELAAASPGRKMQADIAEMPHARADRAALRQVLVNLLDNALKFGGDAVRVELEATPRSGEVEYRVRDHGVGFDPAYAGKLFGVFQRLHSAEQFPGTGIGLAIVKRVVEKHGGRVWAEGKPGEGATFHFTLPIGNGKEAATSGRPVAMVT